MEDKDKIRTSPEMREVIKRSEDLTKILDKEEITESIMFLAMLSCPTCKAYATLEEEGFSPLTLYNTILNNYKKEKKDPSDSSSLIKYSDEGKELIIKTREFAISEGRTFFTSDDMLHLMRSQKNGKISKFLSTKKVKKIKEEEKGIVVVEKGPSYSVPKILYDYGRNLNEMFLSSKIDPVATRDLEITRVINVLQKRTKNNPCLVGEPGVGKTAIIEGLASKIVDNKVPEELSNKIIFALDIPSIVAGCKYRGDFESRLKTIIEETIKAKNIILFIDEIHLIVGAGGEENSIDASNILKPYIGKGELKIIGATTLTEYKRKVEKDPALERRLQKIIVEEPSIDQAIEMLFSLKEKYENFHKIEISKEAIISAVKTSDRYVSDKKLPDKAVDLLDESCVLTKAKQEKIVTEETVLEILSSWTKIPITKLTEDESNKLINLENLLHEEIIAQDEPIEKIASYIRRSRASLNDPKKPIGSFLFAGPSGVGKTYLCKILSKILFNDEDAVIRLDMSEYMEDHSVSKLIGSPPGYVGFEDGGQLTDQVRNKPYSIVLFDEIEKASPQVFNILLQILDEGRLTDSKGRAVNFKNTIIVLTSNLGSDLSNILNKKSFGFCNTKTECQSQKKELKNNVMEAIKNNFRPEFINRIDEIIVFNPLTKEDIKKILDIIIKEFKNKTKDFSVSFSEKAINYLIENGYNEEYGARPLKRFFQEKIENYFAIELISGSFDPGNSILIDIEEEKTIFRKE